MSETTAVDSTPRVLVERDGWRLVLTRRDPAQWPDIYGDFEIEWATKDALGVATWRSVSGSALYCQPESGSYVGNNILD